MDSLLKLSDGINMRDDLGTRMKTYEHYQDVRFMPLLPVIVRLDGKNFSNFTKGMKRPYDERMSKLMIETTKYLVDETNACCGYTQSDEISLVLYSDDRRSQIYFDGRIQKINSVLAAKCSLKFNTLLRDIFPDKLKKEPVFDCRAFVVPNKVEATNCILWREQDATKNAITMAAQLFYSHKQLHKKNGSEKQEMLFQKGVNFNNYPSFFKRGTFVQKKVKRFILTDEQLAKLPEHHEAKKNPFYTFERNTVEIIDMPPFDKVVNRVEVIFHGEEPLTIEKS